MSTLPKSFSASSRRRMTTAPTLYVSCPVQTISFFPQTLTPIHIPRPPSSPDDPFLQNDTNQQTLTTDIEVLVNSVPSNLSIDPGYGIRWTPLLGDNAIITSSASSILLGVCLPLIAPTTASTHAVPFSEMLCVERILDNNDTTTTTTTRDHINPRKVFGLSLFTLKRTPSKPNEWNPWKITIACQENEELIEALLSTISSGIDAASAPRPRRLLVILNPNAGSGAAHAHYASVVRPTFARAGIATTVVETKRPGHAFHIVMQALTTTTTTSSSENNTLVYTSLPYDGVVAVGGDGIFHEILNAVLSLRRPPSPLTPPLRPHLALLRLAHVPCGSTDAVACSLNGCRSVFTATMHICLGDRTALDALRVSISPTSTSTGTGASKTETATIIKYACCIATYGFMGDVVKESEHHRWLGPLRYDVVGALKLVHNQSYRCRITYKESSGSSGSTSDGAVVCTAQCPVCRSASTSTSLPLDDDDNDGTDGTENTIEVEQQQQQEQWKVVEDDWMSIMLIVQPCRSDKTPFGMSKYGHLANGSFTLVMVRACSPLQYLYFLHTMATVGLSPGVLPGVEVIDAVACRVEGVGLEAHAQLGAVQCFARGVE